VAYIETDYAGGKGFQLGMAWDGGQVICPAEQSFHGPINRALAAIGVEAKSGDAFDSLALGHYRQIEDLVAAAMP
jgi:hypothetical protein